MKNITFKILFALVLLSATIGSAQNKGLNLINNKSNDATFLKENRRIKIKTIDGKSIAGKFAVVNDSTIRIKANSIPIDSIVMIRKASTFSSILRPISISIGAVCLVSSIAFIADGGFGALVAVVLIPIGLPLFIVPLAISKHPNKKWKYEIVN